MAGQKISFRKKAPAALVIGLIILVTSCVYMKMNPPPDADKAFLAGNNSCYLATAANMLAGAGYGTGTTVQARSDNIYGDLTAQFGTANGGWADSAVTWWLGSTHNTWTTNPYTVVTVYGNKTRVPWADTNGAQQIGNSLRSCSMVGLSISWPPTQAGGSAFGGHAITAWGDNNGNVTSLSANPDRVRLTDSDQDTGGNVQTYRYDTYTSPNPGGLNSGNGWYIDYSANHPFIKHIVTLTAGTAGTGGSTQKVLGSYKVHQDSKTNATDLHYKVGTDVDILTYRTWLDWTTQATPSITEATPRRSLTVDWNLQDHPVPYSSWVTITTEFILRTWNAMSYSDVHFTYPDSAGNQLAAIAWKLETPSIENATRIKNVTGGHVIGSFEIVSANDGTKVGEYRFIHEYSFSQSPEKHTFLVTGRKGYVLTALRFGHSYGYLNTKALWEFKDWMTQVDKRTELSEEPAKISIDWAGRLPYPEGEIVPWGGDPKLIEQYLHKKR